MWLYISALFPASPRGEFTAEQPEAAPVLSLAVAGVIDHPVTG